MSKNKADRTIRLLPGSRKSDRYTVEWIKCDGCGNLYLARDIKDGKCEGCKEKERKENNETKKTV